MSESKVIGTRKGMSIAAQPFADKEWVVFKEDGTIFLCDNNRQFTNVLDRECPHPKLHISETLICPICCEEFISIRHKSKEKAECPACRHNF